MGKVALVCACVAVLLVGAVSADAAIVRCLGAACGGSGLPPSLPGGVIWPAPGPVDYLYEVTVSPGDHWSAFQVGTDDGNINNYTGIFASSNWLAIGGIGGTLMLSPILPESDFSGAPTPHGSISQGPDGQCPYSVIWVIPPGDDSTASTYYFGFNNANPPHDVGGTVYTALLGITWDENWSTAVGTGAGPLHGPIPEPATISLLGLGLAALVCRRRHKD